MTVAQSDKLKRLMKAVHACRRKVAGLADETTWRGFLKQHGGGESLRAMNGTQLGQVLTALHANGAPRVPGGRAKRDPDDQQTKMVRGLWLELAAMEAVSDRSELALSRFVKRQTGIESLDWLNSNELNNVVEALKSWRRRIEEKRAVDEQRSTADLLGECEALWQRLKDLGAVTLELNDLQLHGYKTTGKAAFIFYGQSDAIRLVEALRRWVGAAGKGKARTPR